MPRIDIRSKYTSLLQEYPTLEALKSATVNSPPSSNPCEATIRSLCWKSFLFNVPPSSLPSALTTLRKTYSALRSKHLRPLSFSVDPLSEASSNPWIISSLNEGLKTEISQDVERCMPEMEFFRAEEVQQKLSDVLFIWCKEYPEIGYRQGMHEICAVILWVVEQDAVEDEGSTLGEVGRVCGRDSVVPDTYLLFERVMRNLREWYEVGEGNGEGNTIVEMSKRVHEELLGRFDPELKNGLERLEVLPQVFLIRWIRLLFSREFPFEQTVQLWDALFAASEDLKIVPYICVSMLTRIRTQILSSDHASALKLLLHYPLEPPMHPTQHLRRALKLQTTPLKSPPPSATISIRSAPSSPPPSRRPIPLPLSAPLSQLGKNVTATLNMLTSPPMSASAAQRMTPSGPSRKEVQLQRELTRLRDRNAQLAETLGKCVGRMEVGSDERKWVEEVRLALMDEKRAVPIWWEDSDEEAERKGEGGDPLGTDSGRNADDVDVGGDRKRVVGGEFAFLLG